MSLLRWAIGTVLRRTRNGQGRTLREVATPRASRCPTCPRSSAAARRRRPRCWRASAGRSASAWSISSTRCAPSWSGCLLWADLPWEETRASAAHARARWSHAAEPDRVRRPALRPAPEGAHHLPRHRGRRQDREPHLRPAPPARGRGPETRHLALHQLAGRLGHAPGWPSTTRCSSSANDVATICMGLAGSMGQFLLCAGTPGKRYALPHARIMMHQPSGGTAARGRHRDPGRADAVRQAD